MKFIFFLIFYVGFGTAGITVPLLLKESSVIDPIAIGLITIVMSSVGYNAPEKIMQLLGDDSRIKKREGAINLFALAIATMITFYVCAKVSEPSTIKIAYLAYVLSCIFWWYQNWNNKNLEDTTPSDALGGNING